MVQGLGPGLAQGRGPGLAQGIDPCLGQGLGPSLGQGLGPGLASREAETSETTAATGRAAGERVKRAPTSVLSMNAVIYIVSVCCDQVKQVLPAYQVAT